jgi:hypothetical protein
VRESYGPCVRSPDSSKRHSRCPPHSSICPWPRWQDAGRCDPYGIPIRLCRGTMTMSRQSCCRNGPMASPASSQPSASEQVPRVACSLSHPPIWICPACRWYRQCCRPERVPKMHLRKPNAIGLAKQFQSTRAASYCPPDSRPHRTGQIGVLKGPVEVRSGSICDEVVCPL